MKYYAPTNRTGGTNRLRGLFGTPRRKTSRLKNLQNLFEADSQKRLFFMAFLACTIIILFLIRLFYLQILHGPEYAQEAIDQQFSKIIIPAERGNIYVEDYKTKKKMTLATNTTLDLIYIDPQEIPDKPNVAKALAPLLFQEEDFLACKENFRLCPTGGVQFSEENIAYDKNGDEKKLKDTRTKAQLILAYEADLMKRMNKEFIDYSPLKYGASSELMDEMQSLQIPGLSIIRKKNLIYVNPQEVPQGNVEKYAQSIAIPLEEDVEYMKKLLTQRKVRYIPLKRKLDIALSEKIRALKILSYEEFAIDRENTPYYFKGVVLLPEHWRFYPEGEIASQVVGYVDHEGQGRYGIEEFFQDELAGRKGELFSRSDVRGAQLHVDAQSVKEAEDGISIVLTIDRIVQQKAEELLSRAVTQYNADNGTIIVMDPMTGEVIADASYPTFNPNSVGDVYERYLVNEEDFEEQKRLVYNTQPIFMKNENGEFKPVTYGWRKKETEARDLAIERKENGEKNINEDGIETEIIIPELVPKYAFRNRFGLEAYSDRSVMKLYEPGSVFKPIAMAIGIDAGEITPDETYEEFGPIEIDTGTGKKQYIRTALNEYRGIQTMTNAIEQSSNIGMAYLARKLGAQLFYDYILKFGFGDYLDVNLPGEQKGKLTYWKKWSEAQLLTTSFGQGISVTPMQMMSSWSALANGGVLLKPRMIKAYIYPDGREERTKIEIIDRVISEETSKTITAMLVSSVENGVAGPGKVEGYRLAGKTGTSQIACADRTRCDVGRYEVGSGTTITSFAGYGPAKHPRFLILVKFERPRIGDNTWGSTTAAPVFKDLSEFLLQYYDVPFDY